MRRSRSRSRNQKRRTIRSSKNQPDGVGINKRNRKTWKRSDSSDSVELMTSLMTPIFDLHLVVSSLTIPTTTPSLVKTSLNNLKMIEGTFNEA